VSGQSIEVVFMGLPIDLYQRLQAHHDELLREFTLIVYGEREGMTEGAVPDRLLAMTEEIRGRLATESAEWRARLAEAEAKGAEVIEVTAVIPAAAADSVAVLVRLLDEADAFCRAGEGLLTLATPPDLLAFRRWFLAQIVDQLTGLAPTPWASAEESAAAAARPGMAELELPADPASAAQARRFVRRVLGEWGADDLEEAAVLLTSELITNSLLHARTPMKLRLHRRTGLIRIEVQDDSGSRPVRRHYQADASTGRGLGLVEALAEEWGVEPANGGKAVWFTLPVERAG
jgi:anti-sigma regulatory factor (Ser/Thr protein kinase)